MNIKLYTFADSRNLTILNFVNNLIFFRYFLIVTGDINSNDEKN